MKIPIKVTLNWEWNVPDSIENQEWYLEELCLDDVVEDIAKSLKEFTKTHPFTCYFCCKGSVEKR